MKKFKEFINEGIWDKIEDNYDSEIKIRNVSVRQFAKFEKEFAENDDNYYWLDYDYDPKKKVLRISIGDPLDV